ncbi:hypothetical protein REPUB_Repub14bG0011600 [Reevesia pubescens]
MEAVKFSQQLSLVGAKKGRDKDKFISGMNPRDSLAIVQIARNSKEMTSVMEVNFPLHDSQIQITHIVEEMNRDDGP